MRIKYIRNNITKVHICVFIKRTVYNICALSLDSMRYGNAKMRNSVRFRSYRISLILDKIYRRNKQSTERGIFDIYCLS